MTTSTSRPAPLSGGNSLTVTSGPERAPLSAKSGFYGNRRRNWRVTFATADYLVGPQLIDSAERPLCARCGRSMINSFGELSPQQRPAWLVSGSLTKLYPVFASDEPGANDESQRIAVACLYHRTIRREALVHPISQMDGCALAAMRCRDTVVFIAGEYPDDTRDHRRRGTTRHLCP